jgi:1-acyl-sn-glycerol-3-phosphate acyltransferase
MRTLLLALVGIPVTAFFTLAAVFGGLFRAGRGYYDWIHRDWSRSMLALAGVRVEVEGAEALAPDRAVILAANHQSWFDILALFAVLPVSLRFVAKKEISRVPLFAQAMRSAGHVFLDRQNRAKAVAAMRDAGRRMKEDGLAMMLFPEGTRSPDGHLLPFKKGSFVLAIETGATLVPVAMDGGRLIMRKGRFGVRSGRISLRCGTPIPLAGLDKDDRDAVLSATEGQISEMLREIRLAPPPPPA